MKQEEDQTGSRVDEPRTLLLQHEHAGKKGKTSAFSRIACNRSSDYFPGVATGEGIYLNLTVVVWGGFLSSMRLGGGRSLGTHTQRISGEGTIKKKDPPSYWGLVCQDKFRQFPKGRGYKTKDFK